MCESSWLPHLLSHSSQAKALRQGVIEDNQRVSDECGSGVVRRHSPYLVCVLCVQEIASCRSDLLNPSVRMSEGKRAWMERRVPELKGDIQDHNARIARWDAEVAELVEEWAAISGKGEPLGCHANNSADGYRLPWLHAGNVFLVVMVMVAMAVVMTIKYHCHFCGI